MRSTPIFKILSLAVLVAVVTLLGIEGYRYFHRSVSVSVAYTGQVTDSLSVTGWVRVFVTSVDQAGQYALLDPPVKTLNLTPGGMQ